MERAANKNYDIYRPNTRKLLLPGPHLVGDALSRRRRGDPRPCGTGGLYPKGQEPKYRTYLTAFLGVGIEGSDVVLDIPPNSIAQTENY
jgi:hypothetical protein